MTDVLFDRIFAPKKDKILQEDLKYKFDLDLKRLYGNEKTLLPWIKDKNGRLAIVILADAINYSVNYDNVKAYEFNNEAMSVAYMMYHD